MSSSNITCVLKGGLGNQLFQIFTTICYALKTHKEYSFIENANLGNKRITYWNSIFAGLKIADKIQPEIDFTNYVNYKEPEFKFREIPNFPNCSVLLDGYFQSYLYFNLYSKIIANEILGINKLQEIETAKADYSNFTSIHFRLGDYKFLPDHHPVLNYGYYRNSVQKIIFSGEKATKQFLLFYEREDKQYILQMKDKLEAEFPTCEFVLIDDTKEDWEQLIIMSCCKNNIIANSTFSFWGAYLNSNCNKIVCYPNIWFGRLMLHNSTDTLIPKDENYNLVSCYNEYILMILSCVKYDAKRIRQKESWLKELPNELSYYHIIGNFDMPTNYKINCEQRIIYVRTQDDYNSLPKKVFNALEAINDNFNYRYIFKTDDDQELIKPNFFSVITNILQYSNDNKIIYDYGGNIIDVKIPYFCKYYLIHPELPKDLIIKATKYCNGRFYFLSKPAVEYLSGKKREIYKEYIEDYAIGINLAERFKKHIFKINITTMFKDFDDNASYDNMCKSIKNENELSSDDEATI